MKKQSIRIALLASTILAATAAVRADCCTPAACATPCVTTHKICVNEWVPEQYQCTRTVFKTECRKETITINKIECVPEVRTRTVTSYRKVCETVMQTRTFCVSVPCVEERTIMRTRTVCKPVTTMVRKCVDQGHYECCEVPCGPSLFDRLGGCFKRSNNCCDPCDPCCQTACTPVRTKTVKKWVPCPVWVESPVTKMVRVKECIPEVVRVCTYKQELRTEQCPVTVVRCIPECRTETYTVMVSRCVPCQVTRDVLVSVPCQETFTASRLVCRKVIKEVPGCEPCAQPCIRANKCCR